MRSEYSRLRSAAALERLYLVAAIAIKYATTQGKPTCKSQVYGNKLTRTGDEVSALLLIGLRWLQGVFHKGRELLTPVPLLPLDPQPVFASERAEQDFSDRIWFSRIRSLTC